MSDTRQSRFLPRIDTVLYYILLGFVAIFVLGPLGGVTAAYMNFSLGFFVGGQVLAGILGSAVTAGYGAEGKHGANYMQTMAASVAGMSGMAVLVQAAVWLGVPEPPAWQLALYFLCIGMFGVGVGMLYTPILVDRMQLTYPSGLAVANILRALTDARLLRQSIGKLGSGIFIGYSGGWLTGQLGSLGALGISTSTIGAGMVVGARIALPALVVGILGEELTPWLRSAGYLGEADPFRKIGFIVALGSILGAAVVDLSVISYQAVGQLGAAHPPVPEHQEWKTSSATSLLLFVAFWAAATFLVATQVLHLSSLYVGAAMGLVLLFLMINGISTGISDNNPISSAFVLSVFVLASLGLADPAQGLMCAAILLVATSVGVDMQQDRSTGWRLGTNRNIQFWFQTVGVVMGAIMAVIFAKVFMSAYPILELNQFENPGEVAASRWQSAMTYKFVGALDSLTHPKPYVMQALWLGVGIGFGLELVRKLVRAIPPWRRFVKTSTLGWTLDFCFDCFLVPSPYAASFGGFVDFMTVVWYSAGGVLTSFAQVVEGEARASVRTMNSDLPGDMSTTSLVGGGLIAGDSLAALSTGLFGLIRTLIGR